LENVVSVASEKIEMLVKSGHARRFTYDGLYFWDVRTRDDQGRPVYMVLVLAGVMHPDIGFFQTHGGKPPLDRNHAASLLIKNYDMHVRGSSLTGENLIYIPRHEWANNVKPKTD
jgi:hypothetical protein